MPRRRGRHLVEWDEVKRGEWMGKACCFVPRVGGGCGCCRGRVGLARDAFLIYSGAAVCREKNAKKGEGERTSGKEEEKETV